eukprot:TRINITY_DN72306_c0_g1_i1.p1 TRINITY_DN72306_c0_g1~~TRINITY_DN72306_c0_g1_i1.p1  ORF type:complete len:139 (+),score=26.11 TRINITY_DN72306_c0_g1_i1:37-453(+)
MPASVAASEARPSSHPSQRGADGLQAAKDAARAGITMAPVRSRLTGVCHCSSNKFMPKSKRCACEGDCKCQYAEKHPPWAAKDKICPCMSVNPTAYNKEVYLALQSRGGAVWERFQKIKEKEEWEKKAEEGGVDAKGT